MTPSISVVICAYSLARWDDLRGAVESVARQSPAALETIVVIDHNDALAERARAELRSPSVLVVENTEGQGLSHARNVGVAAATGEIVAFLDDDAAAADGWLAALADVFAGDVSVAGVGGAIEPRWLGGRPTTFPPEFDWVVGCTYRGHPTTRSRVRNVIGANMSFRRDVFTDAGGFSSEIGRVGTRPVGCEETEFCIRVSRTRPGSSIVYEPAARVLHTVPPERGTWDYFVRRCFGEGISKAVVASLSGRSAALSTERNYVARALTAGIAESIRAAAHGDLAALGRASRMVVGVGAAAAGYAYALVTQRRG